MKLLPRIGRLNQERLNAVLNMRQHTITVEEAATILRMSTRVVAKLLSRWVEQGWLARIKRGVYIPLEQANRNISLKEPWIIAEKLYHPCYISALTAAHYWRLTEQEVHSVAIATIKKPRNRNLSVKGTYFSLRTISQQAMYGLQTVWHEQVKILISDPSRTMIDFLIDPQLGGGISNVIEMLNRYLNSEHRNVDLLFDYAKKTLNGAVLKRLGYLLERCQSGEFNIIAWCQMLKTTGVIKLDPLLGGSKLITRWGLWV